MRGILTLSIALVTLACDRGEAPGDLAPRFTLCSGESNQVTCAQDPCGHRTQSQHGWGAACTGDNAACFRDANFAAAFPEGLYVGCGAQTATLLGSAAVAAALPTSGTPRALLPGEAGAYDGAGDPTPATALFGQTVALSLNVEFDAAPGFRAFTPDTAFADLRITDPGSPCQGMRVVEVLDAANAALGGCDSPLTPKQAHACAAAINAAYVNGVDGEGGEICSDLFAQDP